MGYGMRREIGQAVHGRKRGIRALTPRMALPLAFPVVGFASASSLPAQEAASFDIDRAYQVDSTVYAPFRVQQREMVPMAQALEEEKIDPRTSLLVMDHPQAGRLALVTDQMAYHHVAQGEIAGEPWMVSF